MKKMTFNLHKRMEQIKIWQEEVKLILLCLGAVSAVAVFVTNIWHGKVAAPGLKDIIDLPEGLKGLGTGGGGVSEALPKMSAVIVPHHHVPLFMYINLAVIVLLGIFMLYFGVVVMRKWRSKDNKERK